MTNEKKLILIVEDDDLISSSLRELLEDHDFEVIYAPNGNEALNTLKSSKMPNLILLDLMMPIMDGFQFRENQLKDLRLREIPVVIMSADGHVEEKKMPTGANEYLRKPLDISNLLSVVKKYI